MYEYRPQPEGVCLVDTETGEILRDFPDGDVCFAVSEGIESGTFMMLKHGDRPSIQRYIDEFNAKTHSEPCIPPLRLESSQVRGWTLDQINRCLSTTGYISVLLKDAAAIDCRAEVL